MSYYYSNYCFLFVSNPSYNKPIVLSDHYHLPLNPSISIIIFIISKNPYRSGTRLTTLLVVRHITLGLQVLSRRYKIIFALLRPSSIALHPKRVYNSTLVHCLYQSYCTPRLLCLDSIVCLEKKTFTNMYRVRKKINFVK